MYFFKLFPKHIWTNNSISRVQFFGNRTRSWQNHFCFVILRNFYLKQKMCVLLKYLLHSLIVPGGGTSETLFEGMTLDFLRNVIRSNDQSQTFSLKQKCLYSKKKKLWHHWLEVLQGFPLDVLGKILSELTEKIGIFL